MNILITGATSGLGKQILIQLKKNKENKFFIISRNQNFKYANMRFYKTDLSNHKVLKKRIKQILNDSKNKIDIIICNAAQGVFGRIENIQISEFLRDLNVNFFAHLLIIKSFIPLMKKNKYGHIVNISSGAGIVGLENSSSYSVSKSSMQILIECIYPELIRYNIYCKNIFPGSVKTNFFKKNKYINHKPIIRGENALKISKLIVKNLLKKKINIFCQKKTMLAFAAKIFLNLRKK